MASGVAFFKTQLRQTCSQRHGGVPTHCRHLPQKQSPLLTALVVVGGAASALSPQHEEEEEELSVMSLQTVTVKETLPLNSALLKEWGGTVGGAEDALRVAQLCLHPRHRL
jgi:hypothetical protein